MNMPVISEDFNSLVSADLRTNSRIIAEAFEKRHDNVLRDIRSLIEANPDWGILNFEETPYVDPQNGQTYQMYEMTRDGYSMLAMGFTGRRALEWKIRFLEAFNAMEARLRANSVPDLSDPAVLLQLLTDHASKRIEAEQRAAQAETKAIAAEAKAEGFATKAMALDLLDTAEGNLTVRPASKVLDRPEHRFVQWMQQNRWAFRQGGRGPLQAYSDKIAAGLLAHKLGRYTDQHTGEEKTSITLVITPKGMSRLAQIFAQENGAKK
jgi:Rha family phage regulatory protein